MKTVTWIGEERMIPGFGMGIKGKEKELPVNVADSFIKQGLAKAVKAANTSPRKPNDKRGEK
ncbi:hypothetical protein KAR91_47700 [Candidatus Pacearchaeota archaeon]|nr:hypothetical protein [Candidatus Pacearchaeota archaeon]